MKHFNEDDVDFAVNLARLSLAIKKEENESSEEHEEITSPKEISVKRPTTSKIKFKESKMRSRQISRMATDITHSIKDLEKAIAREPITQFTSPLETETRKRRWQEFIQNSKRTLYSLKREVDNLSSLVDASVLKNQEKFLRLLAVSTRSSLNLLKGLEKYILEIQMSSHGSSLMREIVFVSNRLLYFTSIYGLHEPPSSSRKKIINRRDRRTDEELEPEILTSDMNSDIASVLRPSAVREKLSKLAQKKRIRQRPSSKEERKHIEIIAPLSQQDAFNVDPLSDSTVSLADGRRAKLIHDSLSPKLQRKARWNKMPREECRASQRPSEQTKGRESYSFSEKVADVFFDKLLPFFNKNENEAPALSDEALVEKEQNLLLQIQDLLRRFNKLQTSNDEINKFLDTTNNYLKSTNAKESATNLSNIIKKANESLYKASPLTEGLNLHLGKETILTGTFVTKTGTSVTKTGTSFTKTGSSVTKTGTFVTKTSPPSLVEEGSFGVSIEERLQRQREDFWASLVKRNFIRSEFKVENDDPIDEKIQENLNDILPELNVPENKNLERTFDVPTTHCAQTQVGNSLQSQLNESFADVDVRERSCVTESLPAEDDEQLRYKEEEEFKVNTFQNTSVQPDHCDLSSKEISYSFESTSSSDASEDESNYEDVSESIRQPLISVSEIVTSD